MRSDYERAGVLVLVAEHQTLDTTARAAYRRAAESMGSRYEQDRALAALARSEGR